MARKPIPRSRTFADAVGLVYFLFCNSLLALGVFTDLFDSYGKQGGLVFVIEWVNMPIYKLLAPWVGKSLYGGVHSYMYAEMIIAAASAMYGLLVYGFFKLVSLLKL